MQQSRSSTPPFKAPNEGIYKNRTNATYSVTDAQRLTSSSGATLLANKCVLLFPLAQNKQVHTTSLNQVTRIYEIYQRLLNNV